MKKINAKCGVDTQALVEIDQLFYIHFISDAFASDDYETNWYFIELFVIDIWLW